MSPELIIHVLKLWYRKLNIYQSIGMLLCPILIWTAFIPWVQVNPNENIGKWLVYFPMDLVRMYSGNNICGSAVLFPVIILFIIALPKTRKYTAILFLPFVFFMYNNAKAFEISMKQSVPFYEQINTYIIEFNFLNGLYVYAILFILLLISSILQIFKK